MYKHLIFDFDGTLVDSEKVIRNVFRELVEEHSFKIEKKIDFNTFFSLSFWEKVRFIIFMTKIRRKFEKKYHDRLKKVKMFEHIENVLEELHKMGYHMSIISMNSAGVINSFFNNKGLNIFKSVISAKGLNKTKALKKYINRHKLRCEDVIYLGDEVRDIRACRKTGIDIISVTWGLNSKRLLEKEQPTFLIDEPHEILNIIREKRNNI